MSGQLGRTLTFLFTDIEGSTKRWERQPEAMAKAVARHDEIMRAAIVEHNGHVFKTVGDAFCAVFPTPEDAVAASLAAQRALAAEPWGEIGPIRVRMGIHTGEAQERDADYFGPTVNRTARIASAGHGGQALLSSVTGEHVEERLPPDVRLRSLGKHRLKDLARPERILQLMASGLPNDFPRLKTVPSPTAGVIAALASTLLAVISFRVGNRTSSEDVSLSLLSPLSLYTGLKGLIIELSTINEYVLLAVGLLFLLLAVGVGTARWRAIRREQEQGRDDREPFAPWLVNQRTVAFLAFLALLVLGSYAYQQYLWRVALPIPEDALGIALTREASAATVQAGLADSLYAQGQAEQVIVRELPVVFDARDTDKARAMGERIGARAVLIYREDEDAPGGQPKHIAYLVFTDPSIGLTLAGAPNVSATGAPATAPPVVVKEGVPVPVLQTETVDELINAAAGIIAYDDNRAREAIEHLELAVPTSPDAPNAGIINFYLGNAYSLDAQPDLAAAAYERAAAFYERRLQAGPALGPQDQLILVKTYLECGRLASLGGDWEAALAWYEKGLGPRADVLARMDGLERPSDVPATYARLYTHMAEAYRFQDLSEDQRSWERRAAEETAAIAAQADASDVYALVQESSAQVFLGDCLGASQTLEEALTRDPDDMHALSNAGIVALLQGRPDTAMDFITRVTDSYPEDVSSRLLIADLLVLRAITDAYVEPAYLLEAEAYYREAIAIDPTNLYAHNGLASVTMLRAQGLTLDATALLNDQALTVAKSQGLWRLDPERRRAAIEAYGVVIDERRVIASELQPGDPGAEVAVAEVYLERLMLTYSVLLTMKLANMDNPDLPAMGEQVLADAKQVREWAGRVLDNPSASRLERLKAWAALAETSEREWSWYALFAEDEAKAQTLEQEHRKIVEDAIAYADTEPVSDLDEIAPRRILYFKALFIASAWDKDADAEASLTARIDAMTQEEREGRTKYITHYTTFCTEVREQQAGDAELAARDAEAALAHYEAALEANPSYVNAMLGAAAAHYQLGDLERAIAAATAATEVDAHDPRPWADLGRYQLAAGDAAAADAAYGRHVELLRAQPPQVRMASMRDAIADLRDVLTDHPERAPEVAGLAPAFRAALEDMVADGADTYQLPTLMSDLGALALYADDAGAAEPVLRRALELDPLQPGTDANLVLSVLVQGEDATTEMDAAFAALADPRWARIPGYEDPDVLLDIMEREANAYVDRFPEQQTTVEAFTSRLDAERDRQAWRIRGVSGNTYTSANFDYAITWDTAWIVEEASSDPALGVDSLRLGNGVSTVQFSAAMMDVTGPSACVDATIQRLEDGGTWVTVAPAVGPDGGPVAGEQDGVAYAAFVEPASADAPQAYIYYVDCRALDSPGAFASVFAIVPAIVYERQAVPINELFAGFVAPASGERVASTLPAIDLSEVVAEVPGVTGNVYTSPTFAYRLPIASPWVAVAATSSDGTDSLQLTDGADHVFLDWVVDEAGDPDACVGDIARELANDASIADLSGLAAPDGEPRRGSEAGKAYAVFAIRWQADDAASADSVLYVECRELAHGTMLRILHLSTAERLEQTTPARDALLRGLAPTAQSQDDAGQATPAPAGTPTARGTANEAKERHDA